MAVRGNGDADDIGVAEQVVQVAERFLIRADQEDAEVVFLVRLQLVERERLVAASVQSTIRRRFRGG